MRNHSGCPILVKISALSFGAPLVLLGLALVALDLLGLLRVLNSPVAPLSGLALGPVFAVVGASFLYPLLASGSHMAGRTPSRTPNKAHTQP